MTEKQGLIRVRYAPSPTGLQHIGGVRTALFNCLFARANGGKFILRLEDTDRTRSEDCYVDNLFDTFNWLDFGWDEGPKKEKREKRKEKKEERAEDGATSSEQGAGTPEYSIRQDVDEYRYTARAPIKATLQNQARERQRPIVRREQDEGLFGPYIQSMRSHIYKKYAKELLDKGRAYYCFCSAERLEKVRLEREAAKSSAASGSQTGYDRFCRNIDPAEAAKRAAAGEPCTVRLKIPLGETTRFSDQLLGDIEWKNDDVNPDPVLLKTDGFPTYHLANVVDDHLMEISHVLRAQEWLSSTPLHVIMYKAFGWTPPKFCHLPMVMGQDGKKLSKRHGATSIDEFRRQGYLPDALLNYIALLGASYEEGKEIYTLEELAARFSLEKLNKAPAVFDYKKLEWYNGQYIRMKTDEELAELCLPYAIEAGLFGKEGTEPTQEQRAIFTGAMPLVKERLVFLSEVPEKISYLFREPQVLAAEEFIPKKADLAQTVQLLRHALELVTPLAEAPDDEQAENFIKAEAEKRGVKLGDLMMPLRVAITGSRVSPPLFGSLRILGAECSLERVQKALAVVEAAC